MARLSHHYVRTRILNQNKFVILQWTWARHIAVYECIIALDKTNTAMQFIVDQSVVFHDCFISPRQYTVVTRARCEKTVDTSIQSRGIYLLDFVVVQFERCKLPCFQCITEHGRQVDDRIGFSLTDYFGHPYGGETSSKYRSVVVTNLNQLRRVTNKKYLGVRLTVTYPVTQNFQ